MENEDHQEHSSASNATKRVTLSVRVPLDAKLPGGLILAGIPQYRIAKNRLSFRELEPGVCGGQGVVHQATLVPDEVQDLEREQKVAVKKFHLDSETDYEKFLDSFAREITFMIAASHPNIIKFIGFVEEIENGDAWMVLPWEANGNIREFLQCGEWSIPERISLVQDIVYGLEYLHTRRIPICHGDLKSFNILVNSDFRAVITDFGSARVKAGLGEQDEPASNAPALGITSASDISVALKVIFDVSTMELTLTGPKYTLRWAAPEVLAGQDPDLPSDIWALGWICWEVVTGKLPFSDAETMAQIVAKATLGMLPEARDDPQLNHIISLCSLMSDCWALDPTARPDASACWIQVRLMPSIVPSPCTPDGTKLRSTAVLAEIGYMHRLRQDWGTAESHYRAVLDTASLTDDFEAQANAWNELGHVFATQLRNSDAIDSYLRAQQIYSRIGDDRGIAATWNGLGRVYVHQSKNREAEECLIKAEEIYSRVGNDLGRAEAYSGLGEFYRLQGESHKAEKWHVQALEIHTKLGNNSGMGASLTSLGGVYRILGRYQEAENALVRARDLAHRSGDDIYAGNASSILAELYRVQFRYDEAEKAFIEAKQAYANISHNIGVGAALTGLASVYRAQAKYSEAIDMFHEAEKLQRGVSNDNGVANSLLGQARVRLAQGAFAEAEVLFHRSKAIHSRTGNKDGVMNALTGLGELHRDQGNHAEAERFFDQAQAACMVLGDETGRARDLVSLAKARQRQSKSKEAEESMDEARAISTRIGSSQDRAWILRSLGTMYHEQSRDADAEDCFSRAEKAFGDAGDDQRQVETLILLSEFYISQSGRGEPNDSMRLTLKSKAKGILDEAREISTRIDHSPSRARIFRRLGEQYFVQSLHKDAEEALAISESELADVGNEQMKAEVLALLCGAKMRQFKFGEAETCLTQARAAFAQLANAGDQPAALEGLSGLESVEAMAGSLDNLRTVVEAFCHQNGLSPSEAYDEISRD